MLCRRRAGRVVLGSFQSLLQSNAAAVIPELLFRLLSIYKNMRCGRMNAGGLRCGFEAVVST